LIPEALAVACPDVDVLRRLGGRIGAVACAAATELAGLADATQRRRERARIAAAVRAPVPPGLRGIDASWIEAGIVGLPPRARAALAAGELDPAAVWLVRWACAELPPLPAAQPELARARSLDEALRLTGPALAAWLGELGADQLAFALHRSPRATLGAVANRVVGQRLLRAADRIAVAPRFGALGPQRAALARCRGIAPDGAAAEVRIGVGDATAAARATDAAPTEAESGLANDHLLIRIGARALAPHVDALARRQLAVRLPRPLGTVVRDELAAFAAQPIAEAPAWAALAAPW
jgi:hypothetical protein